MKALAENPNTSLKELRLANQVCIQIFCSHSSKKYHPNPIIIFPLSLSLSLSLSPPSLQQYFSGGAGAEGEIAKYLEKIKTLTKLGYNFTQPSFRTKVDGYIMRNTDYGGYCQYWM